jgi:secondary thiamine-phosphate synthase enzyme
MTIKLDTNRKRQVLSITERLEESLPNTGRGIMVATVIHTGAALTTANLDPGTDLDLLDALEAMIPPQEWRHPHDPSHARDHLLASIIGPSLTLAFRDGQLVLGVWQHAVLVELDGPRTRQIDVTLVETK